MRASRLGADCVAAAAALVECCFALSPSIDDPATSQEAAMKASGESRFPFSCVSFTARMCLGCLRGVGREFAQQNVLLIAPLLIPFLCQNA